MRKSTITRRWLVNNLGVISVLLFAVVIGGTLFVRSYYYSSARQYLTSRMNMVSSILQRSYNDPATSFSSEVRSIVVNWSEKDKTELMVVSSRGSVGLTSSGFVPEDTLDSMADYTQAVSRGSSGYYTGKISSGEHIMAVCVLLPNNDAGYSAIRLVSSLEDIDRHISTIAIMLVAVCLAILFLMVFSGLYFIKSIVI
ncbi:MAG: sensor histidine kinase, partial [Oscillospiraceae bacterium]|nr:sensor histidine kinase [Oscillospiraceae bacterium]